MARSQEWPQKPVRIVVPFPAGGTADGQARVVASYLQGVFKQSFIVENRTGAGGVIGVDAAARAPADGYTLLWGLAPQIVILPHITKLPYDPIKDFAPISVLGTYPFVLVVNSKLPVNNLAEFVAYVRERPRQLTYGTSGLGSIAHLSMALFLQRAGLEMGAAHYRGNAPALADVAAGHIPALFATLGDALPHRDNPQLRFLAVTGKNRTPQLSEVPSIAESGFAGYNVVAWNGLMAPTGTPQPIIDRLAAETVRSIKDPEFAKRIVGFGVELLANSPKEFEDLIASELPAWGKAVDIAGVRLKR